MFGQSGYSPAMSANAGEIERRLRSMEKRLERVGVRTSASVVETADHFGETVAAALSRIADWFRRAPILSSLSSTKRQKFIARRRSLATILCAAFPKDVEHRPLVTLALAVGVGILVGLVVHRR